MKMYSLPDTIKLILNPGDVEINKVFIGMRANNQTSDLASTFSIIPKNTDTELSIPTSTIAADVKDIISYPIWFDYFTMYIVTTNQVVNTTYNIYLKEMSLCYKNMILGFNNPQLISQLCVYPNPVVGNEVRISLKNITAQTIRLQVFNVSGQLVYSDNLGIQHAGTDVVLPIHGLSSGTYFLKIFQDEKTDIVKLLLK